MPRIGNIAVRAAVPGLLAAAWLYAGHAAAPPAPGLTEEISKQERIYRSGEKEAGDGYVTDRSLAVYEDALSPGFDQALAKLGPGDRWLDIGAGRGQAILDYLARDGAPALAGSERRAGKARAVAISIEDRRTDLWRERAAQLPRDQMQYLTGRRLREYTATELGRFQVITDVVGGFSYTDDLSLFMEKLLGFLAHEGTFFTVLQDVHSEAGTNKPYYHDTRYTTEIARPDGSEVKVCAWLKSISCVSVRCQLKSDWIPPVEVFQVRKDCDDTRVPALSPVRYEAGTPPDRRFELRH